MSLFAVVTYDLKGAKEPKYTWVRKSLAKHGLHKTVANKKTNGITRLPANTFVGIYDGNWNTSKAKKLRNNLDKEIKSIFIKHKLKAKYFIIVGDNWAWAKRKSR